jgi:hypothetical protein
MKTIDLNLQDPGADQPNEIPQPGKEPETVPAREPTPPGWPRTDPEIQPGQEPLTAPPNAPSEIPVLPHTDAGPWVDITVRQHKAIRYRYKKCLNEILQYFYAEDQTSPTVVHDLRVNLKRVQAMIDVQRFGNKKLPSRKIRALTALFTMAGKLRSAQIEFDLISQHYNRAEFSSSYLRQLHENKVRLLEDYRKYLRAAPSRQLEKAIKTLKQHVRDLSHKQLRNYFDAAQKRVAHRLRRSVFREQELHLIRKDLKRYYLNLRQANNQNIPLKNFLELLGMWHDRQRAFDHLVKAVYTGGFTAFEREPIEKIKEMLLVEKGQLYDRIASFYAEELLPRQRTKKKAAL